jgi:hypothetical protein
MSWSDLLPDIHGEIRQWLRGRNVARLARTCREELKKCATLYPRLPSDIASVYLNGTQEIRNAMNYCLPGIYDRGLLLPGLELCIELFHLPTPTLIALRWFWLYQVDASGALFNDDYVKVEKLVLGYWPTSLDPQIALYAYTAYCPLSHLRRDSERSYLFKDGIQANTVDAAFLAKPVWLDRVRDYARIRVNT